MTSQKMSFRSYSLTTIADGEKNKRVLKMLCLFSNWTKEWENQAKTNQHIIFQMSMRNLKHLNFTEVLGACKKWFSRVCVCRWSSVNCSQNESQRHVRHIQRTPAGCLSSELQAESWTGFGGALVSAGQVETSIFKIIITLKNTTEKMRMRNNNQEF